MSNIKNSILAGLVFGFLFGVFLVFRYNVDYALIAGPISGLAFGVAIYFFVTSKMVKQQTQITTDAGETIIHSGPANHFVKSEAVGGKLYLLNDKIVFKSHRFNIQNHEKHINLVEVKEVAFYNTLGIIPNGLKLVLTNSETERFVVNKRQQWQTEIMKMRGRLNL